jgi:hypothetical protein
MPANILTIEDGAFGMAQVQKANPLGLKKSFGYGDRLGLATPGHLKTALKFKDFAPIFAQQSIREMERTARTPTEVMKAAVDALNRNNFTGVWGADADHLKNEKDVQYTAAAGFCFFTIDPSAFVVNEADHMTEQQLEEGVKKLVADKIFDSADWEKMYLDKKIDVGSGVVLSFTRTDLRRAAIKYARAIAHSAEMSQFIIKASAGKPYEIEVSVDETDSPTSSVEHLFFGMELKRRNVKVVSLAPRFIGEMEKGIDYKGDLKAFEAKLKEHVAIAKFCGPYKISVHSGSDKFSIYPIVGRVCGDLLHVKTAGTSYLEALRVVVRRDVPLFKEIASYCHGRFATDRKTYHISTTDDQVAQLARNTSGNLEHLYLEEIPGRQVLHVTFGSVLTQGKRANGQTFKDALLDTLNKNAGLYDEVLEIHFDKHLSGLKRG